MKTSLQAVTEAFIKFGKLYQLDRPEPEYIDLVIEALRSHGWKVKDFMNTLNQLVHDDKYAECAKFGKYPTIHDFLRVKHRLESKDFYDSLAAYLSGCWWEKETVLALATPEQSNALIAAGGLSRLYERATADIPTPVHKLLDIVSEHEEEAPNTTIDTDHRIGAPQTIKQII